MRIVLAILAIIVLSGALPPLMSSPSTSSQFQSIEKPSPEEMARRYRAAQDQITAELFREARHSVTARMRDPGSVIFGTMARGEGGLVCGYANGRNGFGGMTGMQPFIAGYANNGVIFYQQGAEAFQKHWRKVCGGSG